MHVSKIKNEQFTPFSMVFSPTYNPADKYICYRWTCENANICEIVCTKKIRQTPTGWTPTTVEKWRGFKV